MNRLANSLHFLECLQRRKETNLSGLLARASLTLGVGHGGGLLSGLGRLSLRKEDQLFVHHGLHLL